MFRWCSLQKALGTGTWWPLIIVCCFNRHTALSFDSFHKHGWSRCPTRDQEDAHSNPRTRRNVVPLPSAQSLSLAPILSFESLAPGFVSWVPWLYFVFWDPCHQFCLLSLMSPILSLEFLAPPPPFVVVVVFQVPCPYFESLALILSFESPSFGSRVPCPYFVFWVPCPYFVFRVPCPQFGLFESLALTLSFESLALTLSFESLAPSFLSLSPLPLLCLLSPLPLLGLLSHLPSFWVPCPHFVFWVLPLESGVPCPHFVFGVPCPCFVFRCPCPYFAFRFSCLLFVLVRSGPTTHLPEELLYLRKHACFLLFD